MGKCVGLLVLAAVAGLYLGVTCTIAGPDGDGLWPGYVRIPLDRAEAEIVIEQAVGGGDALVTASITDRYGRPVRLDDDQLVSINDVGLAGPDSAGQYTATVAAAAAYTITVREPTRGVESTVAAAPRAFRITAPADGGPASLSGFTLTWSAASSGLQAGVELRQTFAGTTQVEKFGPFVDTGSLILAAGDLRHFVQGADLLIAVTKVDTLAGIAGFESGTVSVRVAAVRVATPAP